MLTQSPPKDDLQTGRVIEMPSTYDESTPRAYAFYPGGTSLERWHFDYKDWQHYAIGNVPFDKIARLSTRLSQ